MVFKASKFLSDSEENAEMYLTDKHTQSWVDYCDGKQVKLMNDYMGRIEASRGKGYVVHLDWCEVVK